ANGQTATSPTPMVSVLRGNGDGTCGADTGWLLGFGVSIVSADVNHDGRPDLAVAEPISDRVTVLINDRTTAATTRALDDAMSLLGSNPTAGSSRIECSVAHTGRARVDVTDVLGRVVTTLFDGVQPAGQFELAWDGTNRGERMPAGLYFVRLATADRLVT